MDNYLHNVRDQYEAYSFPQRDPNDERRRLIACELDMLAKINHFGFRGRQNFGAGFHALVAGGGTGDSAIYLAEQLRGRGGRVTYLDISEHSQQLARERARIRGLDNITWVHGSILELPTLGLGPFDYINCAGVLHHLADPDEGLRCLAAVVKDDGCLGLMVYGRYGRIDVYVMQDLMRLSVGDEPRLSQRVAETKSILSRLPANNLMMRGRDRAATLKIFFDDEPNLVDALLHEQDRPYSVAECYAFVRQAGLELIEFTNYQSNGGVCRLEYDPALYLDGLPVMERIRKLSPERQKTIAEIINGSMGLHSFYAARSADRVADVNDPDMVPFFLTTHAQDACRKLAATGPGGVSIALRFDVKTRVQLSAATRKLLTLIDGKRDMRTFESMIEDKSPDSAVIARDFDLLNALDFVMLRHRDTAPIETVDKRY